MSTLVILGLKRSGMCECERVCLRACARVSPSWLACIRCQGGKCEVSLATFKSAAMSVKADGPAAEEKEHSGLYYSDEDDDLGAFSDAEIGCEDGGRSAVGRSQSATKTEGCVPQKHRLWLQRSCVEKRALAAVEGTSESAHFAPIVRVTDEALVLR